ncbi:TetR/AcrR family transcriptional regulator [Actinospica durhamensis]|uniref:TetR/AcrR family transcriptional regulator n=1 Tax=Actinospica durhamensis TaxID=1508375 RepID=A0A941ISC0_9ACTN|nr:TetR family transcriptional regulator [Actinospica durhamensis]MBR7833081.1 TetR/AcrR family transcriptional regulator [Actinospica durhamensis]
MTAREEPKDPLHRPLRADALRNRQRILDSAGTLFATEGLTVSLDEIARHAGVGPGTVHRHFPSKDALIAAVAGSRLRHIVEQASQRSSAPDPAAALRDQLAEMLAEAELSAPLKGALSGTEFDIRETDPEASERLRSALDVLLGRAQHAGTIRTDIDVEDLIAALAGTFHALRHAGEPPDSPRARRLTSMLFDSLEPRPGSG